MRLRLLTAVFVLPALLLAACGGGGDDDATPSPTTPPLTDQEYIRALCTGIAAWVDVAYDKSEPELRTATDELIDQTRALQPPEDVRGFHEQFIKYLEDRREEPASLIVEPPPLPEGPLLIRLSEAERGVSECKTPLFAREQPSPTPGG